MNSNLTAQRYIRHLISLVHKENDFEKKATDKLLKGSSFQLEKRGVAILNLKIIGILHSPSTFTFHDQLTSLYAPIDIVEGLGGYPYETCIIIQVI